MSGIAGIAELARPTGLAAREAIQKMLSVMLHRGPDGSAQILLPGSAFGFLSLASTAFHGVQPLQLANHLIVADARLDDRERLAGKLGVPIETPDPALILKAYIQWGDDCVQHLSGDFSFAIHTPAGVFCARDHLGVKPFYYGEYRGSFLFASEARAIRSLTRAALSRQRIADCLYFPLEHVDKASTHYEGVFRLPPASTLYATSGGVVIRTYWCPQARQFPRKQMEGDAIEAFEAQLEVAVTNRMAPLGSTAMTLSGGVDSTTLVGVALSAGRAVQTFSTVCESGVPCVESDFVRLAVARMPVDAVLLGPAEMATRLDDVFSQLERMQEPFDYAMIQMMLLNQYSLAAGHKSMIDGVEGDMLYSLGSGYPALLYREGKLARGVSEALLGAKVRGDSSYPRALWTSIRQLGAPGFLAQAKRQIMGSPLESDLTSSLLTEAFAQETRVLERLEELQHRLYSGVRTIFDSHYREITHPALAAALERYDRVAALSGIEARHPLVDKHLVEMSLGLPACLKVHRGWSKYILRKSGDGKIPRAISWRTDKSENAWRLHSVLLEHKREYMRVFVSDSNRLLEEYVKAEKLKQIDDDDLVHLFGLAKWLRAENDLFSG